ncbi:phosphotransferase family protein [Streptomyces sp. BE230]|uniref:phosphotransferase family protein n=1 Tax=Streptomyces sp. BE230 TaxID=3002526 RepID=UPI002ED14466|nr:aminoglycoside phosphotransferase family protein [Streptomyces sp. BE230]
MSLNSPLKGSILNDIHAVRCGQRWFIAKCGPSDAIKREAAVLNLLRQTNVPVPDSVLLPATPAFPNDLLLLNRLPGHAADPGGKVLFEAGKSLQRIHRIALPGFGLIDAVKDRQPVGSHPSWTGFLYDVLKVARRSIPNVVIPLYVHRAMLEWLRHPRNCAHLARVEQGVLLHGDLMPKHIWDDGGRLAALIDWGDAMVGDPHFDLARSSMAGQRPFPTLLNGYGLETPPPADLLAFYRAVWSLMALTVECGAGGDWIDGYRSTIWRELAFMRTITI